MSRLYLRRTEIEIFPETGTSVLVTDLKITFTVVKTNESTPNTGKISIYNLSDKTRGLLEGDNVRAALRVGYEQTSEIVFIGDISKVKHERQGCDIVSAIEGEDGLNRYRNSRLDKGYPPNVSVRQVFNDIAASMGLTLGSFTGIPTTKFVNGYAVTGTSREQLNDLCETYDLEWSIQDEILQIIPRLGFSLDSVIVLNKQSGLINFPSKTKDGVEFESLIQPALKIGRQVKIESKVLTGIYKIRKVTHAGDSHSGNYSSKCEATA